MNVLVDTCIWSYAFRSKHQEFEIYVQQLNELIEQNRVIILGIIKQELLSGYKDSSKFEALNQYLVYFQSHTILDIDYIESARFSNRCRQKGIQGSLVDFLICAVAVRLNVEIFTNDKDFNFYQQHLPIKLYSLPYH